VSALNTTIKRRRLLNMNCNLNKRSEAMDVNSNNERSSPKANADEESLYSIPEDSREDIAWDNPSRSDSQVHTPTRVGVELSLVDDPTKREMLVTNMTSPLSTQATTDEIRADKCTECATTSTDSSCDNNRALIRWKIISLVFIAIVVVLCVFIAVSQVNKNSDNRSRYKGSEKNADASSVEAASNPAASPVFAPTDDPSSTDLRLAQGYVYSALRTCSDDATLFEPGTASGNIFASLVNEVVGGIGKDGNGHSTFDLGHSYLYLREKYALGMLYKATNGEHWIRNQNWLSNTDPCDSWSGVSCSTRKNGTCAVRGLALGKFTAACLILL
jgi:large-conductance mechanosensitive channel